MSFATVYLVGRPKDLNDTMSLNSDGIRISLPNYTEVHQDIPESIPGDQAIFVLKVLEDHLHTVTETVRGKGPRSVSRLWSGPTNQRNLPGRKVGCFIELYKKPGSEAPIEGAPNLEQLQAANDDLLKRYGEIKESCDAIVARLEAPDLEVLKGVIQNAPTDVLEAMPYIGPENVTNLKAWAKL